MARFFYLGVIIMFFSIQHKIIFFIIVFPCLFLLQSRANELLLFKNYHDSLLVDEHIEEYVISEKLDGVRAIWDGKNLQTRSGKIIHAPSCFLESFPSFKLDGELWSKYNDFENISSITRTQKSTCELWDSIRYYIFDVPPINFNSKLCIHEDSQKNMKEVILPKECTILGRLEKLQEYLDKKVSSRIVIINQETLKSKKVLFEKLDSVVESGGEGLIIRKNKSMYQNGRNNDNLKLKKMQDSECKIIDYTQGKGKLNGKVGAFVCEQTKASLQQENIQSLVMQNLDTKSQTMETITFKIGSGLKNAIRENPPKIGSIITYKYQGLTKNGIPRFPVFLRVYRE
ncbi:DNA ligase [Helicobacter didelphidarum]|uniref:DNA ligase n=1 Tax=Helicobacter didelphidarum TaxID=2040648 RepID=A0A3D8IL84_9HELI|nr:DNA ligase [Helicobacter didelphidarum]RDU65958.1 DNA ligase [Helicobacter didelphidarum]